MKIQATVCFVSVANLPGDKFRIKRTQVSASVTDADGQKCTAGRANGLERPGASEQHYAEPIIDAQKCGAAKWRLTLRRSQPGLSYADLG